MNCRKVLIKSLLSVSGSNINEILREIKKIDSLSKKKKKKYQEEKLKKILIHSYKNVPYYSKILEKYKVVDNKLNVNLDNFSKLPYLNKEIIRNEKNNLYSRDYKKRKSYENSSGGSTGEPVKFIQDKKYNEWNIANKIYIKKLAGQNIGDKELRFWGSERDLLEGKEDFKVVLRNLLYNRKEFNTFKMSIKDMENYVKQWNKYKPFWIEAYVQSIYEFAKFVKENNLKIYFPKNGILTSAGTLYPDMKRLIEEVFKCKVYNRYGSREVGDMACGTDKLKLSIWNHYLEIIKGKIYVTTLNNYSMPLIRYEIGDIGEMSDKFGFLEKVTGREVNLFKTKEGDMIDGEFFTHEFYLKNWVKKFQVVQKDYELIEIKIVGKENQKDMNRIEKDIKKVMGKTCKINWNFVNKIDNLKNGKYLYTISEVK